MRAAGDKTAEDAGSVAAANGPAKTAHGMAVEADKALRGGGRWQGYSGCRGGGEPRDDHLGNRVKHDTPTISGARCAFLDAVVDRVWPRSTLAVCPRLFRGALI